MIMTNTMIICSVASSTRESGLHPAIQQHPYVLLGAPSNKFGVFLVVVRGSLWIQKCNSFSIFVVKESEYCTLPCLQTFKLAVSGRQQNLIYWRRVSVTEKGSRRAL